MVGANDLEMFKRQQASNDEKQAETVAGVGMSAVDRSTRNKQRVQCVCNNCSNTRSSRHTIPRSEVGHSDREVEEYDVDENGKMIGKPVRIHANLEEAAEEIPLVGKNAIRAIINVSEDGGLLPESRKFLANGEKRPPRYLRYVPRRTNMIVIPPCNKCRHWIKPADRELRIRVDYVNYVALRNKWKRAEANDLRELCNELGIVVEAGLSAAALRKKLEVHYNRDERKSK